ncbi:Reticulocalbin-2 [Danaus plexippus plexippus]|uniref:Reticulocalbin-3 n=1 Tax=Danaus plexippus plexippus TaxID=278856 RepID=A0A212EGU6_DANPL|nr:Reticulocalbin-2 [Danaus plexippus plexippus]
MLTKYMISFILLLTPNILLCASAAVHGHNVDSPERESDGAYKPRDYEHYNDVGHNVEFDHEAILGSVKEAEEYDRLSPEESKKRLEQLLPKMDLDRDKFIDRDELKKWILNSFINLSQEEAEERMSEADDNNDGVITWSEYLRDAFGAENEDEISIDDTGETGMLLPEEKAMWKAADKNGDGTLDFEEFAVFTNPEEHPEMHEYLLQQTLREKDRDGDGRIDFQEYVGDRGVQQDKEWLLSERDKFTHDLDRDKDGSLDAHELTRWLIPDNNEIAEEEVDHLFASADDDHDGRLSYEEVVGHHHVFVGSEAAPDHRYYDEL